MEEIIPANIPPTLPPNFWEKIGERMAFLIAEDAENGIMQNGTRYHKYRSTQYMRYKNNYMNRFTKGGKKAKYNSKTLRTIGTKLKNYTGAQVISNTTTYVNMILTGELFRGLKTNKVVIEDGVKIFYDSNDSGKVLGNRDLGRDVWGLRKENQDIIFEQIAKEFGDQISGKWEGTVTINAG